MKNDNSRNTLALVGFLVSLFGIFSCGFPSIIGLIISAIGLYKANETGDRKGLAIAGLVLGILGTFFSLLSTVMLIIGAINGDIDFNDDYDNDYNYSDYSSSYTYYTCDISFRDKDNTLLMGEEVLKERPASYTKDANGNPAIMLKVKDKDRFYSVTDLLSKEPDKTMVLWSNFDEYYDSFENEKENCGKKDSHCLIYATVAQGFSSDVIITGNYTEEEAKELIKCLNN